MSAACPAFSNAVNDAFAFLGSTHIQMPHDAYLAQLAGGEKTFSARERVALAKAALDEGPLDQIAEKLSAAGYVADRRTGHGALR